MRSYKRNNKSEHLFSQSIEPEVTIQLPIYNEKYVVERLINSICALDYPINKFEVQVLDDSNDETTEIIAQLITEKRKLGFQINHLRRANRIGFKAGALKAGLNEAKGEYVVIFDADFVPPVNFLRDNLGYFADDKVGVVQTPWKHLNASYSLLTRLQSIGLDAHFSIEQIGRNKANHFINFNGTAGIWRKKCILESGGWSSDTLTEDLDLSYRAQLNGWKFVYNDKVGTPAELPANIEALKNQQFRWTKGAAECTRKNLGKVLKANLPVKTKIHSTFHLMNSTVFFSVALLAILSVPMLMFKAKYSELAWLFNTGSIFILSLVILGFFYWESFKLNEQATSGKKRRFLVYFPLFLSFTMGLSLHNAVAVLQGYIGKKSPFVRTPKHNILTPTDSWYGKAYTNFKWSFLNLIEGGLAIYFLGAMGMAYYYADFGLFPLHLMLFIGFGGIFSYSIRHAN